MRACRVLFYSLGATFDCRVVTAKSLFFFKWQADGQVLILRIPSFCFFTAGLKSLAFFFSSKFYFKFFVDHFFFLSKPLFFFLRLKVRGLGYRIKALAHNFFRFFIGTTNLYFFHAPQGVHIRVRRRRMLLVSLCASLVFLVFSHLLLLKKIIPYQLRGVFFPKQLILMKPGKKSF